MKFYRCLICGDVSGGDDKPSNCPFCGAAGKYLVDASKWTDENFSTEKLFDLSIKNLRRTLQLEINNAAFYRDAMQRTKNVRLQGIFKYLSKVEAEHASVAGKILKCELPRPEQGKETAADDDIGNLRAARELEVFAAAFYKQASAEATEPRVKKVFRALSEIESGHIDIEDALLEEADAKRKGQKK